MDPLSISASIAGLITLTEVIVSHGYEFLKGVKHAKAEISQLLVEITALFGVLQSLRIVAGRFEGAQLGSSIQATQLQACHDLVHRIREHLRQALPEDKDGRWRTAGKSIRWPLSSGETKTLIADLEKQKSILSLALQVDGLWVAALSHHLLAMPTIDRNGLVEALQTQKEIASSLDELREDAETHRLKEEISRARTNPFLPLKIGD